MPHGIDAEEPHSILAGRGLLKEQILPQTDGQNCATKPSVDAGLRPAAGRIARLSVRVAIQADTGNEVIPDYRLSVLARLQRQVTERPKLLQLRCFVHLLPPNESPSHL